MKVRMGTLIGLSFILAFLFATTATAQSKCKPVKAHISDYQVYSGEEATEVCGPGDYLNCRVIQFNGTMNGQAFLYLRFSDRPDYGDTATYRGEGVFETNHGEVYTDYVGINFWPTYGAVGKYFNLEPHVLTGGTGIYEGASGVLRLDLTFMAGGEMAGEICWPNE
jgi:hypothetical protein